MAEYISRETMIKLVRSMAENAETNGFMHDREVIECVMTTLVGVPLADVAPVVHAVLCSPDQTRKAAADFVEAIKRLSENPQNLENLQSYLEQHFPLWLKRYANTPEDMAAEMLSFANIEQTETV